MNETSVILLMRTRTKFEPNLICCCTKHTSRIRVYSEQNCTRIVQKLTVRLLYLWTVKLKST